MNTSSAYSFVPVLKEEQVPEPYFEWVSANYPLLSGQLLELEYGRRQLKLIAAAQIAAVPDNGDSRIIIRVDIKNEIYKSLRKAAFAQFSMLCNSARMPEGKEAREFLCYLVLSNGYPAFSEMQERLADEGALILRRLMEDENIREDLHSTVTGIVAYSQNARPAIRQLMLDAFCVYFTSKRGKRPGRRELSSVLFDALNLEIRRPRQNQSVEFQDRLIELLSKHPHPATRTVLSVLANEHSDENVRLHAVQSLRKLEESLMGYWEATTPDQVSTEAFRAMCLAEMSELNLSEMEQIQTIFNSCKGLPITDLSDARLGQLNELMSRGSVISLAAAIALSQAYKITLPCDVAGRAISILTDWAINASEGRYVLDALSAVRAFEMLSDTGRQKVNTAFSAANLKFVLNAEQFGRNEA